MKLIDELIPFNSVVTECFKRVGLNENQTLKNNYNSMIVRISLSTKSSKLTKTSHYSNYQQQLYNEIKMFKEEHDLGYTYKFTLY